MSLMIAHRTTQQWRAIILVQKGTWPY